MTVGAASVPEVGISIVSMAPPYGNDCLKGDAATDWYHECCPGREYDILQYYNPDVRAESGIARLKSAS